MLDVLYLLLGLPAYILAGWLGRQCYKYKLASDNEHCSFMEPSKYWWLINKKARQPSWDMTSATLIGDYLPSVVLGIILGFYIRIWWF